MTTRRISSRRRVFVVGVLGAILSCAASAQKRTVKIGILSPRSLRTSFLTPHLVQRLAELGYREGAGIVLEYRSVDDAIERFPRLARELIDARCDIIFA